MLGLVPKKVNGQTQVCFAEQKLTYSNKSCPLFQQEKSLWAWSKVRVFSQLSYLNLSFLKFLNVTEVTAMVG